MVAVPSVLLLHPKEGFFPQAVVLHELLQNGSPVDHRIHMLPHPPQTAGKYLLLHRLSPVLAAGAPPPFPSFVILVFKGLFLTHFFPHSCLSQLLHSSLPFLKHTLPEAPAAWWKSSLVPCSGAVLQLAGILCTT